MSNISGLGNTPNVQRLQPTSPANKPTTAAPTQGTDRRDRLELSSGVHGALMNKLKASSDVRADKVADIRAQIDAGTYETPEKLDAAIDRLMDDLA